MTHHMKKFVAVIAGLLIIPITMGVYTLVSQEEPGMNHIAMKDTIAFNKEVGTEVEEGIAHLISEGRYKCCLEKPCSYCFTDKDHQDRQLVCDCLVDIMNEEAPCGECTGEILEGEGNGLIAEYFATALADEVGTAYLSMFQNIIEQLYGVPVSKQL